MSIEDKKTPDEELESMSFWDHISALRNVLLKILAIVMVLSIVFFIYMPDIFDNVILAPCRTDFITYNLFRIIPYFATGDAASSEMAVNLINIQLTSQIMIHMTTAFWLGIIFSFPFIIYTLWGFIKPALYTNERKGVKKVFFIGNIMFYLGIVVGYFVVFPFSLRFLANYQVSELVPNQISLSSYMDNFLMLIFMMGIMFELPLLTWMLSRAGIITRQFLIKYRRYAITILLILAAIITPADPFSMIILFIPLYGLFELSILFISPRKAETE